MAVKNNNNNNNHVVVIIFNKNLCLPRLKTDTNMVHGIMLIIID